MHGANGHYGHRAVLNRYAGVAVGTPMPGLLQHGWNHDLGATWSDAWIPAPDPFYVWNGRNLGHCRRAGISHAVPIGAPFLYLPPPPPRGPPPDGSLLAVPIHGWEREKLQQGFEAYADSLAEIAAAFNSVTVSLAWFDHQDAAHRAAFERRGFRVVTVGPRDGNPDFLARQRELLIGHSHVTSNRVQTGLFYALYLGLKGFLHGPPAGIEQRIDRSGELWAAWQEATFPQLVGVAARDSDLRWLGARELGEEFIKSPDELRDLLWWNPGQERALHARCWDFRLRTAVGWRSRWWRRWQRSRALRKLGGPGG